MPTLAALRAAAMSLLQHPTASALLQLNSNTLERGYEAYVLGLCCEAVRRAGGTTTITGRNSGPNPAIVVFRGAPGDMAAKSQDFAYVDCSLGGKHFELHLDVEYVGNSGATHEIDVSAFDHAQAVRVRNGTNPPKAAGKKLVLALECKFYSTPPGVSLCRTFVGLLDDCSGLRVTGFVTNLSSTGVRNYLSPNNRPAPFLGLSPAVSGAEEAFIGKVQAELLKWAGSP